MVQPRPLAGRYAFTKRIQGTQKSLIWIAQDGRTGSLVVASVLSGPRAAGLEPIVGLSVPHAAPILDCLDAAEPDELPEGEPLPEDAKILIAGHVEGRSLQHRLTAGPVALATSVEWAIQVAEVLTAFHERGAVHGAVSPRAILAVRPKGADVPLLTHLLVPPSGAYCSPERVTGGGPSEADDTWALAATLYTALARRPPFQGASRTELARSIVAASPAPIPGTPDELVQIILRALVRPPRERFESAAALAHALREWMDTTGAQSLGDFAPVAAMVGTSEPPPNVGDLSLVAALSRPESAEASAPLPAAADAVARVDAAPPVAAGLPAGEPAAQRTTPPPLPDEGRGAAAPPRSPTPPPAAASAEARARGASTASRGTTGRLALGAALCAAAAIALIVAFGRRPAGDATAASPAPGATSPARPADAPVAATTAAGAAQGVPPGGLRPPVAPLEPSAPAQSAEGAPAAPIASAPVAASAETPADEPGQAVAADPGACVRATLPADTIGAEPDVSYLCTERDLWGIARRFDQHVARTGKGAGMVQWAHLGRFDLAALAVLRARCCPGAAPLRAATPKGRCDTLEQSLTTLAPEPSASNATRYAEDVQCLVSRGIRYPEEWWDRVSPTEARATFDRWLAGLSSRGP